VEQILLSIQLMLNEPNIYSPANIDASNQYSKDKDGYKKKVLQLVQSSLD
jgi:ubiquitin-protein ligase